MPSSAKNPTVVLTGPRLARQGQVRVGVSAVLFSPDKDEVLLTRRSDNGMWCLPGGMVEAGETVSETCIREMREETSLEVRIVRLSGVYSNPDQLVVYPDGNKAHIIVLNFEVVKVGGSLSLSEETTEIRFFPIKEAAGMDLFHGHRQHLQDVLEGQSMAFIR
jgi:ADP-ribose pyrophosphatase YjhB (NUDIX family)